MKSIEVPKIVVLIVVCTAAFIAIIGVLSLDIAMLYKIDVEEALLIAVIGATTSAGGFLTGLLVKPKPETEEPPK